MATSVTVQVTIAPVCATLDVATETMLGLEVAADGVGDGVGAGVGAGVLPRISTETTAIMGALPVAEYAEI